MKTLLRLEEIALAALAAYLFVRLGYSWWLLPLLFLVPDIGAVGYAVNPQVGATYNVVHHRALAVVLILLGALFHKPVVEAAGLLLFFHSSVDRALGFGLKHQDSFGHTHLGPIGRGKGQSD